MGWGLRPSLHPSTSGVPASEVPGYTSRVPIVKGRSMERGQRIKINQMTDRDLFVQVGQDAFVCSICGAENTHTDEDRASYGGSTEYSTTCSGCGSTQVTESMFGTSTLIVGDRARTFESWYDYEVSNAGEPCPSCRAVWVTIFSPSGSKHKEMRHDPSCAYMAWRREEEDADL